MGDRSARVSRQSLNPSLSSQLVRRSDWIGSLCRFWLRTYAQDYLGLAVLIVSTLLVQFFLEPFRPLFTLDNPAIQYPFAKIERVPVGLLLIYSFGVPTVVLAIWAVLWRPGASAVQVTYLGLYISLFLSAFTTDLIKNFVGRMRPDFLDRCQPEVGTPTHILVDISICTGTGHIMMEANRSFPSGHSSLAFGGLGYLSIFLAGQTRLLQPHTRLTAAVLPLIPMLVALLTAITRCEDYRHDVYDVTVGCVLGFLVALFSYRRYYPSLWSRRCEQPYQSMTDGARASVSKLKREDEEARMGAESSAVARNLSGDRLDSDGDDSHQSLLKGPRNGARDDNGR